MTYEPINETGYKRIWCPLCEQDRPKSKYISQWFSPLPNCVHVCNYCVCDACVKSVLAMIKPMQVKAADRIEDRLLKRYQSLLKKLPMGYQSDTNTVIE